MLGPGHELLEQHRVAGVGRRRCEPLLHLLGPVDPERVPRASAREWLGHEREPHASGERARVIFGVDPLTPSAWHAGRLEGRLHPRLVAEVVGDGRTESLDAHPVAHRSQWHLQVFEDRHQAVDGAKVGLHPARGVHELVDIEAVVGAPVPGDGLAHRLRERLHRVAADETDTRVLHMRDCVDEADRCLQRVRCHEHDVPHRAAHRLDIAPHRNSLAITSFPT